MHSFSKRLAGFAAAATAAALALTACQSGGGDGGGGTQFSPGFAACKEKPNECNSGPKATGGTFTMVYEQDMSAWHPNAASGTHFASTQVLQQIYPAPFIVHPDYTLREDKNLMESVELTSKDPQTVVYKINKNAIWNDGTQITAKDFLYNLWTFDGKTCKDCTPATTSGFDLVKDAVSSDGDKTLTVTFSSPYPDWKGLFQLLPAHVAQAQGGWNGTKEDAAGLAKSFDYLIKTQPTISGGPYQIDNYTKGTAITLVQNPKWYGSEKPSLEKLIFRLVEEQSALVPALRNKEVNGAYPQPNVDLLSQVKGLDGYQYYLAPGLSWEHFDINTTNKHLADKALRQAIYTAVDRTEIISKTVGLLDPSIKPLGHQVFVPGMKGYKDHAADVKQGDGKVDDAKKILTDAGYKYQGDKLIGKDGQPVPAFRFRHTVGNKLRADTAALLQQQMKEIGVEIKIETTDTLSKTLSTGDYDIMIFAWVTSPLVGTNLKDLWGSKSGQNYNKYNNPAYDKIAEEAAITVDEDKFNDLVNQGLKLLNEDAITLPLFQRLNFVVVDTGFVNIRNNGTNQGPAYNAYQWGKKAA